MFAVGHDQRPEIGVPGVHKGEHGNGDDAGLAHGQHDLKHDFQLPGAVQPRTLHDFVGQLLKGLAQHEDAEGVGAKGQDLGPEGIDQPGLAEHQVGGDVGDLPRNHEGHQHDAEQQALEREAALGKAIGCRNHDGQLKHDHRKGNHHGVLRILPNIDAGGKDGFVIFKGKGHRPQRGRGLDGFDIGLKRGDDHPVKGKHEHQHHRDL